VALPAAGQRSLDRAGVHAHAEGLLDPVRQLGRAQAGAGGAPVTEAAAAFGYSRPAYYAAAAALESSGLDGLVHARPGPRGASKLTEEILGWAEEQLAADPGLRPAQLPDRIEEAFGVRVHPRSAERALARRRERHSKSRGTARPRDAEGG
jgi:transposase